MSPSAVSVFSGIGGLDFGARIAGCEVVLATDRDASALRQLATTQGTSTVAGDLTTLDLKRLSDSHPGADSPDILIGGPPCTGFSHAGFWIESKREGDDPATSLLNAYADVVTDLRPAIFVMENVPGLLFKNFRVFYESFVNRMRRAGYSVSEGILNSAEFGVAQARRRLFVVGVKKGLRRVDLTQIPNLYQRTSRWAIGDLEHTTSVEVDERPRGEHARWLDQVPPGENYLCLTTKRGHPTGPFEYRSRYWSFLLKLHPDRPSPTIPASRVTYNGPFHWSGRHLRLPELARLQGFPDWQSLDSDVSQARRHIGNAVPPLLGAAVIRSTLLQSGFAVPHELPDEWVTAALEPDASFTDVSGAFPRSTLL
jgi:DNA (cytosine-5)-methyltransferase 1